MDKRTFLALTLTTQLLWLAPVGVQAQTSTSGSSDAALQDLDMGAPTSKPTSTPAATTTSTTTAVPSVDALDTPTVDQTPTTPAPTTSTTTTTTITNTSSQVQLPSPDQVQQHFGNKNQTYLNAEKDALNPNIAPGTTPVAGTTTAQTTTDTTGSPTDSTVIPPSSSNIPAGSTQVLPPQPIHLSPPSGSQPQVQPPGQSQTPDQAADQSTGTTDNTSTSDTTMGNEDATGTETAPTDLPKPFDLNNAPANSSIGQGSLSTSDSGASDLRVVVTGDMIQEQTERKRLEDAALGTFLYNEADFITVMRALAHRAKMNFIAPNGITQKVSFAISNVTPFQCMDMVAQSQGFALVFDNGSWQMRAKNDTELIAKSYRIQYNNGETYTDSGNTTGSTSSSASSSGQAAGSSPQGLPQTTGTTFKLDPLKMLDNIKQLIGIHTTGFAALTEPQGSVADSTSAPVYDASGNLVGNLPNSPERQQQIDQEQNAARQNMQLTPQEAGVKSALSNAGGGTSTSGAQVVYSPDDDTFFVIATRQQHAYVLAYLKSADQPQTLVAVECRLFESTKDPAKAVGFDWSGTLGGGYDVSVTGLNTSVNLTKFPNISMTGPSTAILSMADLNLKINAFLTDKNTLTVSYPRVVTSNNRAVTIQSVVQQPVLSSSSTVAVTGSTGSTQSVQYLPVGTTITTIPRVLPSGTVKLRTSIAVSSIIGQQEIAGSSYPVATTRIYSGENYVDSGYTLAIGGLEETDQDSELNKVPVLGDIPLIGFFFRNRSDEKSRKNLMIFITPTVLDGYRGGIRQIPETVADTRSDPNNSDTAMPNSRNLIDPQATLLSSTLIDKGMYNAINFPTDPKAPLPYSALFVETEGQTSLPLNPKIYAFNEGQIYKRPNGTYGKQENDPDDQVTKEAYAIHLPYDWAAPVTPVAPADNIRPIKVPGYTDQLSALTYTQLNIMFSKQLKQADAEYKSYTDTQKQLDYLATLEAKAYDNDSPKAEAMRKDIADRRDSVTAQKDQIKHDLNITLGYTVDIFREQIRRTQALSNSVHSGTPMPSWNYAMRDAEVTKLQQPMTSKAEFEAQVLHEHITILAQTANNLKKGFGKAGHSQEQVDDGLDQLTKLAQANPSTK